MLLIRFHLSNGARVLQNVVSDFDWDRKNSQSRGPCDGQREERREGREDRMHWSTSA